MRRSDLVFVASSVVLLAACSTNAPPATSARPGPAYAVQASPAPTTLPVSSPSPVAVASPSPLAIPHPTWPFVRCDTADLQMQMISVGAAAGNLSGTIEVRNKSSHDCDLYGYAGLQLLDARGRPLPTKVTWSTSSFFLAGTAVEAVVGLPAATPPITPDRPVPGHAYIPISWNDAQGPCSEAVQIKVTPPDAFQSLVISATPAERMPGLMTVCSGGSVLVNPTRAAVAG